MKILIVDDREENRTILRMKLSVHGYTSETASNGVEGLAKLRRDTFDAVITDLMMPGMDGYQFTHAIKTSQHLKHLPVIIYTSTYTDPRDEALARNLGANAFILKPATDEKFFSVVAETIAKAGRGELPTPDMLSPDEVHYLRSYTARLIQKLEDKVEEAAAANIKLSELNTALEARVSTATAALRDANAELEAYVNSVTHDLRAPLRAIEGFSILLSKDDGSLSAEEKKHLADRISQRAAQMQELMQDLLNYSRLKEEDITLAPVDLEEAVKIAVERNQNEIASRRAQIDILPPFPRVFAFEPVLIQALTNLINNGIKFVAEGIQPQLKIAAKQSEELARVTISDNGIGIPEEKRGLIFKIFERLHDPRSYPGTGVGLAMVHRSVQKMGGKVGFTSQLGVGSVFWIELRVSR